MAGGMINPKDDDWDEEVNPNALESVEEKSTRPIGDIHDRTLSFRSVESEKDTFGKFTDVIKKLAVRDYTGVAQDLWDVIPKDKMTKDPNVGLKMQIAQETGIPLHTVDDRIMRNWASAQGFGTEPTKEEIIEGLFTVGLVAGTGGGLATIPAGLGVVGGAIAVSGVALKTLIGVGSFMGVMESLNMVGATLNKREYRPFSGEGLAPEDADPLVKDLFGIAELIIGGIGAGGGVKGVNKGINKIGERFFRDAIDTYNLPRTVRISPAQLRELHGAGREDVLPPEIREILKTADLSRDDYVFGLKNGIDLEIPTSRLVEIADSPMGAKIRKLLKVNPGDYGYDVKSEYFKMGAPKESFVEFAGKPKKGAAGLLEAPELTGEKKSAIKKPEIILEEADYEQISVVKDTFRGFVESGKFTPEELVEYRGTFIQGLSAAVEKDIGKTFTGKLRTEIESDLDNWLNVIYEATTKELGKEKSLQFGKSKERIDTAKQRIAEREVAEANKIPAEISNQDSMEKFAADTDMVLTIQETPDGPKPVLIDSSGKFKKTYPLTDAQAEYIAKLRDEKTKIIDEETDDVNFLLNLAAKQDQFQEISITENSSYDDIRTKAAQEAYAKIQKKMKIDAGKYTKAMKEQGRLDAKEDPIFKVMDSIVKKGGLKYSSLEKDYSTDFIKELAKKRPRLVSKSGIFAPDVFAQEGMFESADVMLNLILEWQGLKSAGEKMAMDFENRFTNEIGDAELSDYYIEFLNEELKIFEKMLKGNKPKNLPGLKKSIRENTGQIRINKLEDVKLTERDAFMEGLKMAEKASRKAFSEGKMEGVYEAKQKQLDIIQRRKDRLMARERVEDMKNGILDIMADEKLPQEYRDSINDFLADYDLRPRSTRGSNEVESARAFIEHQEEIGEDVSIPKGLLDKIERYGRIHYREMTLDELTDIYDQAKMLQHLGRLKNKLIAEKNQRDFDETVNGVLSAMKKNWPGINRDPTPEEIKNLLMEDTFWEKVKGFRQNFTNSLVKAEYFIRRFDGWKDLGPAWNTLYKGIGDSYGTEFKGLEKITATLENTFKPFTENRPLLGKSYFDEVIDIDGVPQKLTKEQIIMVGLNSGNIGNRTTLTGGKLNWTEEQIDLVTTKLTEKDWDFVRSVWGLFKEQLPALQEVYRGLSGRELKLVEGDYFPIVLDTKLSWIADKNAAEENARNFFKSMYPTDPKVVSGSTIERTGTSKNPLLSFSAIFSKLAEVNHYTSHALAVRDTVKILKDPRVRMAIETMPDDVGGPGAYKELMKWVQDVAVERKEPLSKVEDIFKTVRANTTIVALGLKFSVGLFQGLGATQTIEMLKGGQTAFAKAGWEYYKDRKGMIAQIREMSPEMRARPHQWDRELNDAYGRLGLEYFKGSQKFKDFCFWLITMADMEVSYISWNAAFSEGMNTFKGDQTKAVDFADSVVRRTQGVSMIKDLASIQKGSELQKMVTMFYTFWSSLENQMIERGLQLKYEPKMLENNPDAETKNNSYADYARTWWWLIVVPAVLAQLSTERRLPDSPAEAAKIILMYRLSGIPFVRDLSSYALGEYDYQFSPVVRGLKVAGDVAKEGKYIVSGDADYMKFAGSVFEASGYAFGLPTGQALITAQGIMDLNNGVTSDFTRLLLRAPREDEEGE